MSIKINLYQNIVLHFLRNVIKNKKGGGILIKKRARRQMVAQVISNIEKDANFRNKYKDNPKEMIKNLSVEVLKKELKSEDIEKVENDVKFAWPAPYLTDEELKTMLGDILNKIKRDIDDAIYMEKVLFWFGIIIIAAVFILDIVGIILERNWQAYVATSGVIGTIGIGAIWQSTHQQSSKVKDFGVDFVQLNLTLIGYLNQQSALMGELEKNPSEGINISKLIKDATADTIKLIQDYC